MFQTCTNCCHLLKIWKQLFINWQSETTNLQKITEDERHFNWYAMHQVLQEVLGKRKIGAKFVSVSQQRSTVSQTVKTSLWPVIIHPPIHLTLWPKTFYSLEWKPSSTEDFTMSEHQQNITAHQMQFFWASFMTRFCTMYKPCCSQGKLLRKKIIFKISYASVLYNLSWNSVDHTECVLWSSQPIY